jgi:hypothetical protein
MCNVVGCSARQGLLRGHMLEKCPNYTGDHIVFSSMCAKQTEAARAARQGITPGEAGLNPTNEATHTATAINRVVLGQRPRGAGTADGGREEKADGEQEEATVEARDLMITEAEIATTTATTIEAEALATND